MEMLNELALFAGAGGGILGGLLAGWRTVCAVEWDAYAACILVARQNDGTLAPFPIWDDVQTFDGRPWRGRVDVVSGGFPCTDISAAGKGAGIDGEASGMWRHMARIIGEVRPRYVLVENSPMLVGRGLARVVGDFAAMGYDARWGVLGAADVGAPHQRDRIWIVATDADCDGQHDVAINAEVATASEPVADAGYLRRRDRAKPSGQKEPAPTRRREDVGDANSQGLERADAVSECCGAASCTRKEPTVDAPDGGRVAKSDWWCSEPDVGRVAHGVANRVDRLRCIGNGQVPRVAALAWEMMR